MMSNVNKSRREALKKLGIATGVGAVATTEWSKPVMNALVVPAHAQTTSGSSPSTPLSAISNIDVVTQGSNGEGRLRIFSTSDYTGATITNFTAGAGTISSFDNTGFISASNFSYFTFTASANFNSGDL